MELRFNVFGRLIAVRGEADAWTGFYLGDEGKRRPADFVIPSHLDANGLAQYLGDLFHEEATPRQSEVVRVK